MEEPTKSPRLTSIDMLRGLVIVLMALDHSRDYFGDMRINPHDAQTASVAMYLTRFVTHFCAPTFVFLAGVSAWLYGDKHANRKQLSWFLFSRGLWLLILDHTLIYFSFDLSTMHVPWIFLVISAIGVSMMIMSVLCWLPMGVVGLAGVAIIFGHNLFDPIAASQLGPFGWIWSLIHERGFFRPPWMQIGIEIAYPVLPWLGVMAAGFGIGPVFKLPARKRRMILLQIGAAAICAFLAIRGLNIYGDPRPWAYVTNDGVPDFIRTAMSFGYCEKYPPSLCYVLMTLGPALIVLALLEFLKDTNLFGRILLVFGRVPLFFYVLHFYLLSAGSMLTYWVVRGKPLSPFRVMYGQMSDQQIPEEFGFPDLNGVYVAWIILLIVLYPLCLWYGERKRVGKSQLWSYL